MKSLLHYSGSKRRIASWIIGNMPEHHRYLDPPYVLSTRGRKQYRYEMSDQDHEELLDTSIHSRAKIMLSGYDCELYERYLKGQRKIQIQARAQNSLPRVETLWMNFEPVN